MYYRYAYKDDKTNRTGLEINLEKIAVLTIPDWSENNKIEVVQYSKYDTVEDLYLRLIDPASSDLKVLWRVVYQKTSVLDIIKNVKDYYNKNKRIQIWRKRINPCKNSVMTLDLNKHSILIIENIETKNDLISSNKKDLHKNKAQQLIMDQQQITDNSKIILRQSAEKENSEENNQAAFKPNHLADESNKLLDDPKKIKFDDRKSYNNLTGKSKYSIKNGDTDEEEDKEEEKGDDEEQKKSTNYSTSKV